MAGEGVPYQAQSEGFPDVPVRSEMGVPYIIKPEDWLKQAEFNLEQPGAYLNAVTKSTEGVTNLIQNTWQQQLALKQAQASLDKTVADTGYTNAWTDNINARTDLEKQQTPLAIQQDQQRIKQNDLTIQSTQDSLNRNNQALDEMNGAMGELNALDPDDPNIDQKRADIENKYRNAFANSNTLPILSAKVAEINARVNASTAHALNASQTQVLQGYQQSGLLPTNLNIRDEVAAGRGQQWINQAKQQEAISRLNQVKEYAQLKGNAQAAGWADTTINEMNRGGGGGVGGETPAPLFDPHTGNLLPGTAGVLNAYEQQLGLVNPHPGAKMEIGIDPKTGKPYTKISGLEATQADIEAAQKGTTPPKLQAGTDLAKDPIYQQVFSDIVNKRSPLPAGVDPNSPQADQIMYQRYLQAGGKIGLVGGAPPASTTVAPPVGGEKPGPGQSTVGNIWFPGPGGGRAQPQPKEQQFKTPATPRTPGLQNVPTIQTPRRAPFPRAGGGGTRGKVGDLTPDEQERFAQAEEQIRNDPSRTDEEKQRDVDALYASLPGAEEGGGEELAQTQPATYQTQVQNAAAPRWVSSRAEAWDPNQFNFGNATTFGLTYGGGYDPKDDGRGAFGHNTRDPRLIGASVNVNDMRQAFGPGVVTPRADGRWDVNPRFAQLARNGDVQVQVVDPQTHQVVQMPLVDVGPGSHENARLDLTYAASHLFRTEGRRVLGYKFVDRNGNQIGAT